MYKWEACRNRQASTILVTRPAATSVSLTPTAASAAPAAAATSATLAPATTTATHRIPSFHRRCTLCMEAVT